MMRSISRPPLNISRAGMLRIRKRAAVTGFSSTLSLATRIRPENSAASCSTTGASCRRPSGQSRDADGAPPCGPPGRITRRPARRSHVSICAFLGEIRSCPNVTMAWPGEPFE